MADKSIDQLVAAESILASDLFVLQQSGIAKKLSGQLLLNWLTAAADGHGGIASITKHATAGLVDTYRITLADTTFFDFAVTNGRGVQNIEKTSTSGLIDTYTITLTDGTSSTFTVTNGAKGDKGDTAYIWIKYASQQPNESSHSFGDLPDAWMGIYFGFSATAPTDWSQYRWYNIKGQQGETGVPATLVNASVTYQVGDSGTVIPSGDWSNSIPIVAQGKYLWTKIVQTFNTGTPITAYTVSRMGIDGLGSVVSVNNQSPDANGNINLDASALGALSKYGATMEGPFNMNGQTLSGLNDPASADEAVPKRYVDSKTAVVPTSVTSGNFLVGNGQSVMQEKTPAEVVKLIGALPAGSTILVPSGGTGKTSVTAGNFLVGNGTDPMQEKTPEEVHEMLGVPSWTKLWENASPASDFAAQTLSIDLTEYDYIEMVAAYQGDGYASGTTYTKHDRVQKGETGQIYFTRNQGDYQLVRTYKVMVDGIEIREAYRNGTERNSSCTPIRIYGIKGAF